MVRPRLPPDAVGEGGVSDREEDGAGQIDPPAWAQAEG